MKRFFSAENSLDAFAALIAAGAVIAVLQTFVIGQHFVIPTMILTLAVLFGNLARFGVQGRRWAKHMLFWIFFLMTCYAFFALFWAESARPGEFLGAAFYPVFGGFFAATAFLCWQYARKNALFG